MEVQLSLGEKMGILRKNGGKNGYCEEKMEKNEGKMGILGGNQVVPTGTVAWSRAQKYS